MQAQYKLKNHKLATAKKIILSKNYREAIADRLIEHYESLVSIVGRTKGPTFGTAEITKAFGVSGPTRIKLTKTFIELDLLVRTRVGMTPFAMSGTGGRYREKKPPKPPAEKEGRKPILFMLVDCELAAAKKIIMALNLQDATKSQLLAHYENLFAMAKRTGATQFKFFEMQQAFGVSEPTCRRIIGTLVMLDLLVGTKAGNRLPAAKFQKVRYPEKKPPKTRAEKKRLREERRRGELGGLGAVFDRCPHCGASIPRS